MLKVARSPIAIVLHGTTSAGKSSLAKALQSNSKTPVFHISMDAFACMANRADMRSEVELDQAFKLHCQNLQTTLQTVSESHFDIVLDLVLRDEPAFVACLNALSSRKTFVIGVHCPLEILEQRERTRQDRAIGMAREQFGHATYDREYSMRLDTSTVTAEQGAQLIREFVESQSNAGGSSVQLVQSR